MEAVKRGKPEPLLGEARLCAATGWTLTELEAQPARFVELMAEYLSAEALRAEAEARRAEREAEERVRRIGG